MFSATSSKTFEHCVHTFYSIAENSLTLTALYVIVSEDNDLNGKGKTMEILFISIFTFGAIFSLTQFYSRSENIGTYNYTDYIIIETMKKLAQDDVKRSEEDVEVRDLINSINKEILLPYLTKDEWNTAYSEYHKVSRELTKDYQKVLKTQKISTIDQERDATRLAVEEIEKAGEKWNS